MRNTECYQLIDNCEVILVIGKTVLQEPANWSFTEQLMRFYYILANIIRSYLAVCIYLIIDYNW